MKRIGVVTATRAEYGLLRNTIKAIIDDNELELELIVTGTHLLSEYGHTIDEIIEDGFPISKKIDIISAAGDTNDICKIMGSASMKFSEYFQKNKMDILIVLGDRYELLSICSAAMAYSIPIAHISGGETTEGAIDEAVRHCITKMSYLHFPGCEEYRKRIIQLGESPDRVFNWGDVGVENIIKIQLMSKEELEESIDFKLDRPYFSVTFHPVTLENNTAKMQIEELLSALDERPQYKYIITKANADPGNLEINDSIDKFVSTRENCVAHESLGIKRYLSLLKYSSGIIGNSSSGIVEAPVMKIPTINIGDRQKGRLRADSIIDCNPSKNEILAAIDKSQNEEFKSVCKNTVSLYGVGDTSVKIVETIKDFLINDKINLKKNFYDVDFKY